MDTGKVVISKLNGANYLIWAAQLEALLQARGVWEHVELETPLPDRSAANCAEVSKDKNIARAAIICSLEPEFIPMVASE